MPAWGRSRLGRRVVGLFIVSALVPLSLCAAFLLHDFAAEMGKTKRQNLDVVVRGFGMTLLGRLGSVDDVLTALVRQPGMTDNAIQEAVANMSWVRSVSYVSPVASTDGSAGVLPLPDARQVRALQSDRSVILHGMTMPGEAQVYLVRALPSDAWLYTELSPIWLWADAGDYAEGATLVVVDGRGQRLLATAEVSPELLKSPGRQSAGAEVIADGSMARSWEAIPGQPLFVPLLATGRRHPAFHVPDNRESWFPVPRRPDRPHAPDDHVVFNEDDQATTAAPGSADAGHPPCCPARFPRVP